MQAVHHVLSVINDSIPNATLPGWIHLMSDSFCNLSLKLRFTAGQTCRIIIIIIIINDTTLY